MFSVAIRLKNDVHIAYATQFHGNTNILMNSEKKCRLCVFSSPVYTPYHKPGKYACCSNMKMWLLLCHVDSGAMGCYGCK